MIRKILTGFIIGLAYFSIVAIAIIIMTLISNKVFALEQHDGMTIYTMPTDEPLTVGWDDANLTLDDYFEFYLWNFGEQKKYLIGKTQAIQVTMQIPRTGLWVFYVRACDKPASDNTRECSIYATSASIDFAKIKDPDTGQFVAGKWMVYGHVAAPTGGGVD